MSVSLFIDRGPLENRVALIEDERIAEIHVERVGEPSLQGQIRRARVTNISHDLQAATLDSGEGLSLFLRAADARVLAPEGAEGKLPIGKLVQRGQSLFVQVGRVTGDGKQTRCSADIALRGRYVILHPLRRGLEPDRGGDEDAALAELATEARIVRRPAANRTSAEDVAAEAARLLEQWRGIESGTGGKPGQLAPAPDMLDRALLDFAGAEPETIMVPDRETLALLRTRAKTVAPDLDDRIERTDPQRSLDLDDEIDRALSPEVPFKGGRLTIEPTRAMTVIDIDGQGQPVQVNLAAAEEIARQLRLRRIGGPVAIDFITMGKAPDRKRVETAFRKALKRDPEQTDFGTIDRFGIATMVRRHGGLSLADELSDRQAATPGLKPEAMLARMLRRAALELAGIGPLPITIELSDQLEAAAPADLTERLAAALNRPLQIRFRPGGVDDLKLSRER